MIDDDCQAAVKAWESAERQYREESARYVSVGWGSGPIEAPEKVITPEALDELARLREAAKDAQDHYVKVCRGD